MYKFDKSLELFNRASQVIPGGIYGHTSPVTVIPGGSPYYAERSQGAYYWDIDGNRYIDFMCGYGPAILGYNNPEIEAVAAEQRSKGAIFNHPTEAMVKLAELLTKRINFADWAVFAKNGSDLTTWAVQVTREATGKSGILKVKGAYHGVDAWCTPGKGGIIEEDVSNVFSFQWNSEEDFDNAINKNLAKLAAVIITPYHHPVFADNEMPKEGFLQHIQKTCNKHGIILILDDVRAGFRLHTNGSHQHFGFKPDIACYCKALANGYPISAAAGIHSLKVPASRVFLTGSYWNDAVSMSAALKCLEIIERDNVPKKVLELGNLLKNGLENSAKKHGHDVIVSGPPSMPSMRFANETNFYQMQKFSSLCIQSGVFFHPHHNWFLSSAHTIEDIEEAISIAENVFSKIEVN